MAHTGQDVRPDGSTADARRFACRVARLLDDSRCEHVLVLDLRRLSPVTDYFVIATGTSDRQIASVRDNVQALGRQDGQGPASSDGAEGGGWVVADFFDVVVHLFSPELRVYYDLESLWGDAPQVDWRAVTQPGQFAKLRA
jgi:ribosome-associated protein